MKIKNLFLTLFIGLILLPSLSAEYNRFEIPDSCEIRKELADAWFNQDLEAIQMQNVEVRKNVTGETYQVSLEEDASFFYVYVSPKTVANIDIYDDDGVKRTIEEEIFPINGFGSWVYARKKTDGKASFIKINISRTSDVFIQFRPNKNTALADFVIYNSYAAKGVPLGIPFEKLLTMSITEIYNLTKNTLPWKYVEKNVFGQDSKYLMIDILKKMQDKIAVEDDAMYDERGNSISILDGNPHICKEENKGKLVLSSCGYVKWVVDGLIDPLAGSYLKREPLIRQTVDYNTTGLQGGINERFSVNLSLDWTRNIAAAALSVRSKKTYLYEDSGVDVKVEPFTAVFTNKGIANTSGYIKNTGYQVETLRALLYVLSRTECDYFYLAAIRQSDRKVSPEVRVFNDAAIIIPYIDSKGVFRLAVFMSGKEISFNDFERHLKNAGDCFVHLTRVKTDKMFYPQGYKP